MIKNEDSHAKQHDNDPAAPQPFEQAEFKCSAVWRASAHSRPAIISQEKEPPAVHCEDPQPSWA